MHAENIVPESDKSSNSDGHTDAANTNGHADATTPPKIDLNRLRVSQNYGELVGVTKALTTVRHGKPPKSSFIQVHPDEA